MAYVEPTNRVAGNKPGLNVYNRLAENQRAHNAYIQALAGTFTPNSLMVVDGSGDLSALPLSEGSLVVGGSSGPEELDIGSNNTVLKVVNGRLEWGGISPVVVSREEIIRWGI